MKQFIINLLFFSSLTIITFLILDKMITTGLRNSNGFVFENLTRIHKGDINSNLIINGSSKALVQVSPQIIDSLLNFNSYNFGMNGANFELQSLVYQLYRSYNSKPNYIIQIVGNETLELNENLHEYKRWTPYLNDSLVRKVIINLNGFSFIDYYLPSIRYSGFSIEIINGISNYFNINLSSDKSNKYKGYIGYDKKWDNSFEIFKEEYPEGRLVQIDTSMAVLFNNYIESCLKDSIKVILVYPPIYHESHNYIKNRDDLISLLGSIADRHQIPFIDFSEDELSYSKQYFYNSQHLNKKGSELFTKKLINELLKNNFIAKDDTSQN
jgi:hypothetical protein